MLPGGASDIAHSEDIEQDDSDVSYTSDYSFYEAMQGGTGEGSGDQAPSLLTLLVPLGDAIVSDAVEGEPCGVSNGTGSKEVAFDLCEFSVTAPEFADLGESVLAFDIPGLDAATPRECKRAVSDMTEAPLQQGFESIAKSRKPSPLSIVTLPSSEPASTGVERCTVPWQLTACQRPTTPPCLRHVGSTSIVLTDAFETQAVYLQIIKPSARSSELWELSLGESKETALERHRDPAIDAWRKAEATCVAEQWVELSEGAQFKVIQGVHGFSLKSSTALGAGVPLALHGLLVRTGRDWADTNSVWQVTKEELARKLGCSVLGPGALIQAGCGSCANVSLEISEDYPNIVDCVTRRVIDVGDILCAEYSLGFPDAMCVSCRQVALRHTEEGSGRLHRGAVPQGWNRLTRNCETDGMLRSYYWRWDTRRIEGNDTVARCIELQWEVPHTVGSLLAAPLQSASSSKMCMG